MTTRPSNVRICRDALMPRCGRTRRRDRAPQVPARRQAVQHPGMVQVLRGPEGPTAAKTRPTSTTCRHVSAAAFAHQRADMPDSGHCGHLGFSQALRSGPRMRPAPPSASLPCSQTATSSSGTDVSCPRRRSAGSTRRRAAPPERSRRPVIGSGRRARKARFDGDIRLPYRLKVAVIRDKGQLRRGRKNSTRCGNARTCRD